MLDINQTLRDARHRGLDGEDHLCDLDHWSPLVASQLAKDEGIELEDEHWEIIYYLRERYRERGNADDARVILRELMEKFSSAGQERDRLYTLFAAGPVSQGSRIAGLPLPRHSRDVSFGSVM